MQAEEVNVLAKIPGYLTEVYVHEGDQITAGDPIFATDKRDLEAKAVQAAEAQLQKAQGGARPQEIAALAALSEKAQVNVTMLEADYTRMQEMEALEAVSASDMGKLTVQLEAARLDAQAANEQYELVQSGARSEDIKALEGQYQAAQGTLQEVEINLEQTTVLAPCAGTITRVSSAAGELVGSGSLIASITDYTNSWVETNVTEMLLGQLSLGQIVSITSKAYPDETFSAAIVLISKILIMRSKNPLMSSMVRM